MFFRNLTLYRLDEPFTMTAGAIEELLAVRPLQPCTGMSMQSRGWVSPSGDGALVYSQGTDLLIALGFEDKLLPSTVIRQEVETAAKDLERRQGYKPGRKQLRDLKERVTGELLPRAFVRRSAIRAWIDPVAGWVAVDTSSTSRAEDLLAALRNTGALLSLNYVETETSPQHAMTAWLAAGNAPRDFALDDTCQLIGTDGDKPTVQYARHSIEGQDIKTHIACGKRAARMGLIFGNRVAFVLTDKFQIKKLAYLDMQQESAPENAQEQFDADFALATGCVRQMLGDLVSALGGFRPGFLPPRTEAPATAPSAPSRIPYDEDNDPLFQNAVEAVRAENKASVSLVQRRLKIDYNRAARLVERMESEGIITSIGRGNFDVVGVSA